MPQKSHNEVPNFPNRKDDKYRDLADRVNSQFDSAYFFRREHLSSIGRY
jgi:hypothetical protein